MPKIGTNTPKSGTASWAGLFKLTIQVLPPAPDDTDFLGPGGIQVSFFSRSILYFSSRRYALPASVSLRQKVTIDCRNNPSIKAALNDSINFPLKT
jgi:hypothetical protein